MARTPRHPGVHPDLRAGVCAALERLGAGFLADPTIDARLASGALSSINFYHQLLRLVLRLAFLFVAEDRDLFHTGVPLRRLATSPPRPGHTLWRDLRRTFDRLDDGDPALALPALGGLWRRGPRTTPSPHRERATNLDITERADPPHLDAPIPDLDAAELADVDLLAAVTALDRTPDGRPVPWDSIDGEALGWAYEALLDREPAIDRAARTLRLTPSPGRARTSGSYYTPPELVDALLRVALDPPIDAIRGAHPDDPDATVAALLALRVCDPACGAGHFLVAAARRLARAVASCRTATPTPRDLRRAMHDVVARCIHGVDLDPIAVELCKFVLWIEALDPPRPLPYLDDRIQQGNAIVGASPPLCAGGIPEQAWLPLEGDDPAVARRLRRRHRDESRTAAPLPHDLPDILRRRFLALDALPSTTRDDLHTRERTHAELLADPTLRAARLGCDLWCAAFVWPKTTPHEPHAPTAERSSAQPVPEDTLKILRPLARDHSFFHWHLAFPHVFGQGGGGFDVVLGNPPWETLSPDAKEFFAVHDPAIRTLDRAGQQRLIQRLLADPAVADAWTRHRRGLYALAHFIKHSGRYRLHADGNHAKGDLNIYRAFIELALALTRPGGTTAQVVPEGLINGSNCTAIRDTLFNNYRLITLLGFENARGRWFPGVHTAAKFTLYAARADGPTEHFTAAFNLRSDADLRAAQAGAVVRIPVAAVRAFAPDTLAVLEFRGQRDIDIVTALHARWPRFGAHVPGHPRRHTMRELDMGNDRERFSDDPAGLPLYEGRMISAYDHRARGYIGGRGRTAEWCDYPFTAPDKSLRPQWRIPLTDVPRKLSGRSAEYRVGFCDVASPTNERSLVAALVPPGCVCGDKVPTIVFRGDDGLDPAACIPLLAAANSFTLDYLVRKQISLKISYAILDNLPIPRLTADDPTFRRLAPLVLRLTCTDLAMLPFWDAMAARGLVPARAPDQVPGLLDPDDRLHAVAAIEAIVARHLYGLDRDALAHILDTFPVVRRRDLRRTGEYRTRRLVLAAFDAEQPAPPPG